MGNSIYRLKPGSLLGQPYATQLDPGHSDYRSQSNSFTTVNAPWNVTQWIDPFDPYPKVITMPVILVIRK